MELISIRLPEKIINELDELVMNGEFASRAEVIRYALYKFLADIKKEKHKNKNT